MYQPRLIHGLLEDDPDRRLQFYEVILKDETQGDGHNGKIPVSGQR